MKGTEKQIAYAKDIIAKGYANLDSMLKAIESSYFHYGTDSHGMRYEAQDVESVRATLKQIEDAFINEQFDAAKIIERRMLFDLDMLSSKAHNFYHLRNK